MLGTFFAQMTFVIQLDPSTAANALSLTTQIPAQMTFFTDGKSHIMRICNVNIKLIHTSPKKLAGAGTPIGIIIQALRYYGTEDIPTQDFKNLQCYTDFSSDESNRNQIIYRFIY